MIFWMMVDGGVDENSVPLMLGMSVAVVQSTAAISPATVSGGGAFAENVPQCGGLTFLMFDFENSFLV